jgi:hypothetical protein
MLSTVYLAAEDVPGLAVGHRLVAEQSALSVYRDKNGHGFGNLKKKAPSYFYFVKKSLDNFNRVRLGFRVR